MSLPKFNRFNDRIGLLLVDEESTTKAAPRTLFVKRRLLNADVVRAWAQSQGIATALPPEDMHVTVAFSRAEVDWAQLAADPFRATAVGGDRAVHQFPPRTTPNGALVLKFASPVLTERWQYYRDAGASWDFPNYQPHVTLTYSVPDADVAAIEPYTGPLTFGPEELAEVSDDWVGEIRETPLAKFDPSQPRDGDGQWTRGGWKVGGDFVTAYHGASSAVAKNILKQGIRPGRSDQLAWVARDKSTAELFGSIAAKEGKPAVLFEVRIPRASLKDFRVPAVGRSAALPSVIPAKWISGYALFDPASGKADKFTAVSKAVAEVVYVVVVDGDAIEKFDPSQPRAEDGKWTSGGGGGATLAEAEQAYAEDFMFEAIKLSSKDGSVAAGEGLSDGSLLTAAEAERANAMTRTLQHAAESTVQSSPQPVWRGSRLTELQLESLKRNKVWEADALTSTTDDPKIASIFLREEGMGTAAHYVDSLDDDDRRVPVMFEIQRNGGIVGHRLGFDPLRPSEVLLPKGARYRVTDKLDKGDYWLVRLYDRGNLNIVRKETV